VRIWHNAVLANFALRATLHSGLPRMDFLLRVVLLCCSTRGVRTCARMVVRQTMARHE